MIPIATIKDGRVDPKAVDRFIELTRQSNPSPSEIRAQQINRIFAALKSSHIK